MSAATALSMTTWTPARKGVAGLFIAIVFCGLACAAVYLSAVIFLVLNKMHPRHAEFRSIATYWDAYADDPKRRRQLIGSVGASGIALLVVLPFSLVVAARRQRPLHGDARFATEAEIVRAGLLDRGGEDRSPRIIVGRHRGRFLRLPGQLSVMLSAPTRSGKGVGVVVPNLLNWPDSVVALDIKGENYEITAGYRAAHGQRVYAFSPFDEQARSHRWNPLTAVRTNPLHRVGDLLAVGQVFFPNDGTSTSSDAFFNDQARNLFMGLGLYLLETPALPRTLGEMLRQSSGKGQSLKDHLSGAIGQRVKDGDPLSDECADALNRLLTNSENTLTSIVSTFNAPLTIFADAIVDAATSADDFRLEDLRRKRITVYVRVPPNRLANARPLLNLFFSQLVSLNTQQLPEQDRSLRFQCLLINDEFAAMGRVGVISTAAAFLAGYNLRLLTVVQAMSQLDVLYGDKEARTFATNHGLQILYAPREQRDADEYSAMLGHFTERATSRSHSRSFGHHGHSSTGRNESDQRRALLLPQEFKELGPERLVVIFENCKPILGEKIRYHRDKVFKDRLRRAPVVPRMNTDLHLARTQQRMRYADDELADGQTLSVDDLAQDFSDIRVPGADGTAAEWDACIEAFLQETDVTGPRESFGGSIEALAPDYDDGISPDLPSAGHERSDALNQT
ncbi:type IV secretory system conjugative DNA transfer family protein [Rhizobacter sp. Root404]|uniref:type IV secretory system conjugative DNA transfer family protein n=1 Tax=Rhizobacter sp. Root404 TaxID=1736528 RepID=UPI0009EA1151|nr:type IV secretory system conjugative DNA transfer family protein [Rhizobacter sp. Root404]